MNYYVIPGLKNSLMQDSILDQKNIIGEVACHFGIALELIRSKSRKKDVLMARTVTAYFLRKNTRMTLKEIGQILGKRDHATILHAVNKISDLRLIYHDIEYHLTSIYSKLTHKKTA